MSTDKPEALVLASRSPRRKKLLQQLGYAPLCWPADIDETAQADESPSQLVQRLARQKAAYVRESSTPLIVNPDRSDMDCASSHSTGVMTLAAQKCVVIGADTVIDLDGRSIGKPVDRHDCLQTLALLAGREHRVHSGICVIPAFCEDYLEALVTSTVRFGSISDIQAQAYWESGEPLGKAGSYAIQGLGAQFVASLSGSYSGVMGLPLYETAAFLRRAGMDALPT